MQIVLNIIAAALALALAGVAHAQTPWYGGLAFGQSKATNISEGEVNDLLRTSGYTNGATSADKKDTTYRVTLGYQFTPNIAAEALYTDIGQFGTRSTVTGGSVNADYKSSGYGIGLVLSAPVTRGFSIFARAGVLRTKTEADFSSNGVVSLVFTHGSSTRSGEHFGVGLQYDLSKEVALRLEAERFNKLGDDSTGGELKVDAYTFGAIYRF